MLEQTKPLRPLVNSDIRLVSKKPHESIYADPLNRLCSSSEDLMASCEYVKFVKFQGNAVCGYPFNWKFTNNRFPNKLARAHASIPADSSLHSPRTKKFARTLKLLVAWKRVRRVSLAPRLDPYVRRLRDKIMDYADPRIKRPRHDLVSKGIVYLLVSSISMWQWESDFIYYSVNNETWFFTNIL